MRRLDVEGFRCLACSFLMAIENERFNGVLAILV
jgi:hypothetical protein